MKDRPVVYIGVDVAKDSLSVDAGEVFKGEIENSTDAIRGLLNKLTKRCVDDQVVCICFESTGPYGERLFLECCEAGVPACILNPAKVRHYAKAMSEAAKTDPIDARVIRLFAENKRPEPTPPPSAATIHLRKLVLTRNALMKSVVQLSGTQETVVGSAAGEVLAKAIAELRMRIKELDRLITHAIAGDQRIAGLAAALAEIDGVGKLSAAKMVAMVPELGTLGRRRSAALAGLAPFTRDSGRYKGKTFISGGRAEVRRALFMPATVAIKHNPVLRDAYQNLRKNGKPYKVAITAIMRRLFQHMDAVAAQWLKDHAISLAETAVPVAS
jgi:transposase